MKNNNEEFTLYDLRVDVIKGENKMICNHKEGHYFDLCGENLSIPTGQTVTIYSLAALLPILPAKQRLTHENDWMSTDAEVACPDPHCDARFRITRVKKHVFKHSDVSVIPVKKKRKKI